MAVSGLVGVGIGQNDERAEQRSAEPGRQDDGMLARHLDHGLAGQQVEAWYPRSVSGACGVRRDRPEQGGGGAMRGWGAAHNHLKPAHDLVRRVEQVVLCNLVARHAGLRADERLHTPRLRNAMRIVSSSCLSRSVPSLGAWPRPSSS